ncbi:hypothetical protein P43SY_008364 [Pythium insidiosum]|uniref:BZIP domain-containing protein n=1 Tax=Pythium insidiosum TaxID=114742 RepID=A0AAD5QDD2_PYTIN|nr:hypothetical protein P43SY_008364 [Pythium insidiosum]
MEQRRRRRRVAIELPPDQASSLNKDELKRWKNRIAAARARERTQRQVQELQATVHHLWQQNQQQKALIDHLQAALREVAPNHSATMVEPLELAPPVPRVDALSDLSTAKEPHALRRVDTEIVDVDAEVDETVDEVVDADAVVDVGLCEDDDDDDDWEEEEEVDRLRQRVKSAGPRCDSDIDREIDRVVDRSETRTFAGSMVVDAGDVAAMESTLWTPAQIKRKEDKRQRKLEKNRQRKAEVKAAKAAAAQEAEAKAAQVPADAASSVSPKGPSGEVSAVVVSTQQKTVVKTKTKKTRVSVVVTESETLEVVTLENEVGLTESGAAVHVAIAPSKKAKKKAKKSQSVEASTPVHNVDDDRVKTPKSTAQDEKQTHQVGKQSDAKSSKKSKQGERQAENKPIKKAVHSKKDETAQLDEISSKQSREREKQKKSKQPKNSEASKKNASKSPSGATSESATTSKTSKKERAASKSHEDQEPRADAYDAYWDSSRVEEALARGELVQGKLRVNAQFRLRAFLTVEGLAVDVLVDGVRDRNRAMDGDLVAVEILPEEKWKSLDNNTKSQSNNGRRRPGRRASIDEDYEPADAEAAAEALQALWRPNVDTTRCFVKKPDVAEVSDSVEDPVAVAIQRVAERSASLGSRPTGRVVYVLAPGAAVQGFVGSLVPKTRISDPSAALSPEDDYAYFDAQDPRVPRRVRIPRLQLPDEFVQRPLIYSQRMLCFCRLTKWSERHSAPMGQFVKTLGEYAGIESGISAILLKYDLLPHTRDFSSAILDELTAAYGQSGERWEIPESEMAVRRDFRDEQIFSIDPYNARDLDDALHIRPLDAAETRFEVGVHIADVTHFVAPGSLLDKEAQQRATSVYLANRVLPMLPRVLCERLCSLQPKVDRLAFSVVWEMNADGSLVEGSVPWFGKSIIRSCCKLDYGSAQKMLDGVITAERLDDWESDRQPLVDAGSSITPASVIRSVQRLWRVAKARRQTRFDTGAVTLQDVKLVFTLDASGNPTSFGTYQLKDSNRLVEEYMLLANYLVAQRLLQAHGPLAFIRRHGAPNEQSLENTLSLLSENAIDVDGSSPKALSESLADVRAAVGDIAYGVVQNLITKPMKPAEYVVAGFAASPVAWRHYALNIPYYTHFTSPIRRYADVVVHRLLQESLVDAAGVEARVADPSADDVTQLMNALQVVAQNCNEKKMTAKHAEKECDQVFLCAYVKHTGAIDVTGVVVSFGQKSFTVYISELGIEQRLEVQHVGARGVWNPKTSALTLIMDGAKAKPKKKKQASQENVAEDGDTKREEKGEAVAPAEGSAAPQQVVLKFMTTLRLRMTTTETMPLALRFRVTGSGP